jgi:hypothetical protein
MGLITTIIQLSGFVPSFAGSYFSGRIVRENWLSWLSVFLSLVLGILLALGMWSAIGDTSGSDTSMRQWGTSIWFSIAGCAIGAFLGRTHRNIKNEVASPQTAEDNHTMDPREEEHYAVALREVEGDSRVEGIWGKAIANSEGDIQYAKSLYIQYRVEALNSSTIKEKSEIEPGVTTESVFEDERASLGTVFMFIFIFTISALLIVGLFAG